MAGMNGDRAAGAAPAGDARVPVPFRALVAAGAISAGAVLSLIAAVVTTEGNRNVGYLDIAGIPTACSGDTVNVVVGKFYSDAECRERTARQAAAHMVEVLRCTPRLKGRDQQLMAASLLAYNIGGAAYCRSTVDRKFDAEDWRGGCAANAVWNKIILPKPRSPRRGETYAGRTKDGRYVYVVQGLINRRAFERAICMKGL